MCNGFPRPALFPAPETELPALDPEFSHHEGILILQLFEFFDLLSQKQYPLLPQCGLDFRDSDQGAQVFQLSAILRQADAAHAVGLFT